MRLGGTLDGCIRALNALKGSFVRLSQAESNLVWEFQHPTISDAYGSLLAQNSEHVEILVEGMPAERLVSQATCGNMEVRGAVVIPKTSFPLVIEKLRDARALGTPGALSRSRIESFLARRCSDDFLSMYIENDRPLLGRISEPELANRLLRAGLFPEHHRRRFVERFGRYALDGVDATVFTNNAIKAMFTAEEFEALVKAVRQQVLPSLSEFCSDWLSDADYTQTPEDAAWDLVEFLGALKSQFADEPSVVHDIEGEIQGAWYWVDEHEPQDDATDEAEDRELASEPASDLPQANRSIFDDIDADEEADTAP